MHTKAIIFVGQAFMFYFCFLKPFCALYSLLSIFVAFAICIHVFLLFRLESNVLFHVCISSAENSFNN